MQASLRLGLAATLLLAPLHAAAAEPGSAWPAVTLPAPADVKWSGSLAAALDRGVARLAKEPYTVPWLLADVSLAVDRIFTNYSGDVSGRFIELAALSSPPGKKSPASFDPVLAAITRYQRADGHFGVEMDLSKPLAKGSPPIPMLWGNARLLVGLVTCHPLLVRLIRHQLETSAWSEVHQLAADNVDAEPSRCPPDLAGQTVGQAVTVEPVPDLVVCSMGRPHGRSRQLGQPRITTVSPRVWAVSCHTSPRILRRT
jgi:hypothetical protein